MSRLQTPSVEHFALGQARESAGALAEMIKNFHEIGPYPVAWTYIIRRDRDKAFELREPSDQLCDPGISWVRGDTLLSPLHSAPRWPIFLRKLGPADDQLK